jgi:hypothetical protein
MARLGDDPVAALVFGGVTSLVRAVDGGVVMRNWSSSSETGSQAVKGSKLAPSGTHHFRARGAVREARGQELLFRRLRAQVGQGRADPEGA